MTTSEVPPYQQQQQQQQQKREQHHASNRALDETKDNIRRSTDEARNEIPRYTRAVNEYQEQTIQTSREIADNYTESQKQIINSLQSACLPKIEQANRIFMSNSISPRHLTEIYANMVISFADNMITATANNSFIS
jgi:2-succinyl-5-enolpyruvyl-6-hydroxy-3-cyclohexene-1-carboxylate synthase